MMVSFLLKCIWSMAILAQSTVYAEEEIKVLLIFQELSSLDVRTFWKGSTEAFDPNVVENIPFIDALLLGNYRSPYIDTWDTYAPDKVFLAACNIFGDVLWRFSFNTSGSTSQLSSWLHNTRYLHSYPDDIAQSAISFNLDRGISVSAGVSGQLTTLLNVSLTNWLSSIVIFTDEPDVSPPYESTGCYHYTSVAADASTTLTDNLMDVDMCFQACSTHSASTHFMIQYITQCSCGTMVSPGMLLAESQCLYYCPGNMLQKCGGVQGVYSVYSKNNVKTILFEKTDELIPSSSVTYLQSNLHQINNSEGTPMFINGIVVSDITGDNSSMYSLYYSPNFCTSNSSLEGFNQYRDNNSTTAFPANGSLKSLLLLPYLCLRLATTSATGEVKRIDVTLHFPDKYTTVPFFVIEGVYTSKSSSTEVASTTELVSTSSETESTTTLNELSSVGVTTNALVTIKTISTSATVQNSNPVTCVCDCNVFPDLIDWELFSPEEKERMIRLLIDGLKVNKKNLSSTIRRKSSASDERKSAAAIGFVGIMFLSIVLGLLVIPDCLSFLNFVFKLITVKCKTKKEDSIKRG